MGPSCKIYALKRIRLQGRDPEAAAGFIDEIELLQRLLNKPNIIQLIESQVGCSKLHCIACQAWGHVSCIALLTSLHYDSCTALRDQQPAKVVVVIVLCRSNAKALHRVSNCLN
jgi:serine/threonine-protein kinase TTK/MPS1